MAPTDPNPFTLKEFIVIESSNIEPSNPSRITVTSDSTIGSQQMYISQPMNILELEKYLMIEINKFLMIVRFARTCDKHAIHGFNIPSSCKDIFKNFTTSTNQSQLGIGANVFDNFVYTDAYINKQQNMNDKKSLSKRLLDLKSMITDFQRYIDAVNTPEIKSKYPDEYNNIMQKYAQNLSMRSILDQKLDDIYSTESRYGSSKRFLDSTIYTSVLWTILATTLVFYIFKKM
jgi:hypothetical protein